jgi:hypothetical protein
MLINVYSYERSDMETNKLEQAAELAGKTGCVFIATADSAGVPHIAAAGRVEQTDHDCLAVSEWFCPGTVKNLQTNRAVSVVVWDKDSDAGFQLLGHLQSIKNIGILDGFMPGAETQPPMPQEERQLRIRIDKILSFKRGPHSDMDMMERDMPLFTGKS